MRAADLRAGRYLLEGIVGSGAFATVYRGRDERLDDVVAVKVLADNHCLDARTRERFIDEGRILRRARSPSLVAVHDMGETVTGQPYLVLEYADRGTLAQRRDSLVAGGHRIGPDEVAAVAGALASAVGELHRLAVVHRDLTPANLLLCSEARTGAGQDVQADRLVAAGERVLLADLGLGKDLVRSSGLSAGVGTDGFRAPEQHDGLTRVDRRADVWSMSAIVVWAFTGQPPDQAGAWASSLAAAGAGPDLVRVIGAGLSARPERRPASASAWWAAIEGVLRPAGAASPKRRRGWRRSRVALAALVGAAAGAGVTGAVVWRSADNGGAGWAAAGPGLVRAEAAGEGVTLAVTGPRSAAVGAPARFVADAAGTRSWVWIAPDGATYPDAPAIEVTASTPGQVVVHLVATARDGRLVQARLAVPARP